ncbi:MAG: cupin domain-containing protein [Betaproteobacteria bacterium]|jgi:50S ribosomal protein L16 3-hydroxylase|nr:MAG: cupin domain-containing protein [Betaproteobacteria bacterium]
MDRTLLGGLAPSAFLKRHWQKQPLLIRGAVRGFRDPLTLRKLMAFSRSEACEARLVISENDDYEVLFGPFSPRIFRDLPEKHWTLLVQGVNHVCREARDLLYRFAFLPYARLDDVMVSYAAPGGGVGPHFDSYDVFLLQGCGQRQWEVGTQSNLDLVPDADLRILRRFRPQGSCVLSCGDMLYLPPRFAHNGTALDSCVTYSIGFRAPTHEELKTRFLTHLDDCLHIAGQYQDPGVKPTRRPAHLDNNMITQVAAVMSRIRWNRSDVTSFLGRYLSEPKPYIVLAKQPNLDFQEFSRRARVEGIDLHPALPLLFHGKRAFINGDVLVMKSGSEQAITSLANERRLTAKQARSARRALPILHGWYGNGYVTLGNGDPK